LDTSNAGKKAVACSLVALNQFEDKKRKKKDEKDTIRYGMTFMTGWRGQNPNSSCLKRWKLGFENRPVLPFLKNPCFKSQFVGIFMD
jgi:hypothetical protein